MRVPTNGLFLGPDAPGAAGKEAGTPPLPPPPQELYSSNGA